MKARVLLLFILTSLQGIAQPAFDTVKIRPLRVTDQVYMLLGSGGNIGLLTGKDGLLMVDDQFAPLSEKINYAIKSIDPGTLRFLVNTHLHGDHSGGNENFKRMGVTIVAHDQVRERMSKETQNRQRTQTTPPRDKDAWPVVTFADQLNFHLNDEDIELIHLGRGHTDGDLFIHFKKANVFHCGDSFVRYGYPYIDLSSGGTVNGFIANLDKLLGLLNDNSKVIPGHGALATKADVKVLRDQLADIRDQVAAAIKKGKHPDEIPVMGITDKYEALLGKGFIKGKDFVITVTESLLAEKR